MALGRRARRTTDIWPGFVDALATLLMVIIFVLLVFVLAQFFLGSALSGREQALSRLGQELAALTEQLSLQKRANESLRADLSRLSAELQSSVQARDEVTARAAQLDSDVRALEALKAELEAKVAELDGKLGESSGQLAEERKLSEEARAQAALLNRQIDEMRRELQRVAAALEASEKLAADQKVQIADLGKRLNVALAGKVEELQRYRSEFFGRLRAVLGNRPGIRIEGDRFVFQSELLFDTGSAELGLQGIEQVRSLARTLNIIAADIPKDVNWIMRVDGHTDRRPITGRYANNWELSTARAITVVQTLIANGVPPDRLAATGFGEHQPLDGGSTEAAYSKNRRIELRLDQR
ncbi:MAG: peptidoglycan -binding protein [Pseudomonadota bacterium]